jgi:hypothetical protein
MTYPNVIATKLGALGPENRSILAKVTTFPPVCPCGAPPSFDGALRRGHS